MRTQWEGNPDRAQQRGDSARRPWAPEEGHSLCVKNDRRCKGKYDRKVRRVCVYGEGGGVSYIVARVGRNLKPPQSHVSDKETDQLRLLPGHSSRHQSLLKEGAPQGPRPALMVTVPTCGQPGAGPPPQLPGPLSLVALAPPWGRQHLPRDTSLESSHPYQFLRQPGT